MPYADPAQSGQILTHLRNCLNQLRIYSVHKLQSHTTWDDISGDTWFDTNYLKISNSKSKVTIEVYVEPTTLIIYYRDITNKSTFHQKLNAAFNPKYELLLSDPELFHKAVQRIRELYE